jgi:hypothetical protein
MTGTSFGEHAALVSEVLDFAKEGRLLVPSAPPFHCRPLRSLDSATDYAWRRTNRGDTWTDLREREVAHVKGVGYREPKLNEVRSDLRRVNDGYFQVIKRRLGVRYRELSSDVHADLMNCALKRALLGPVGLVGGKESLGRTHSEDTLLCSIRTKFERSSALLMRRRSAR